MLRTNFKVEFFGISDQGLLREHNEDAWVALGKEGAFVLADGMGGHNAGEVAANEAVNFFSSHFRAGMKEGGLEALKNLIEEINSHVFSKGEMNKSYSGMGTTLCCLYLYDEDALLGHVGDSRIYLLRGTKLKQLTQDHSLINELKLLGTISDEEAEFFPYKHTLTKALGTNPTVQPSVTSHPLNEGDLFLLCSDGLTNFVKDKEIEEILNKESDLDRAGHLLVKLANEHGGGDNITLILVRAYK